MTDNVLQTLQRLVQDVIAPDVRELKVRLTSFEKLVDERFASMSKEMDTRFSSMSENMDTRFASMSKEMDTRFSSMSKSMDTRFAAMEDRLDAQARQNAAQFEAIHAQFQVVLSAISESRAQADLAGMREIAQLRERVAVIESRLPAKAS
ncbi:hypothetical protein [Silvibacterium acidisoli]|uniref:hypothetical protein n=1 Tax=Acidobacteriaceae bacterium ZG23-2 TaxID=2883246 RepID=UPI00406CDB92